MSNPFVRSLVVCLVALGTLPACASAAFPGMDGRIAFFGRDAVSGPGAIFSVSPDGSNRRQLSTLGDVHDPSWSADGDRITYTTADREAAETVWVMDADGGNARRVVHSAYRATPSFSPDGRRIIYSTGRGAIKTTLLDGTHQHRLVRSSPDGPWLGDPEYSPDGRRIVFSGVPSGSQGTNGGIWTMRADGTHLRRLTRPVAADENDVMPDYRPDGRQIVFYRSYGRGGILKVMSANGSDKRPLPIDNPGVQATVDGYPAFSPTGDRIAFSAGNSYYCTDLYTVTLDGSETTPLTDHCGGDSGLAYGATWQPLP